ncbi:hypothetical protein AK812_SmicGene32572 [Symbiodinium microadriaticum]|uniref:Uncharacterized protein n=1 Tax=Symbiodinium microadriaticum TaxID=2951 RepID=A0A1Q9CTX9_SYMMI|nr:hypothetical protein AK812_SmicGene32572 [Symbiodinium microadriaticum]
MDALAAVGPVIHRPVPDMREDSAGLRDASELLRQLCPVPFPLELTKRVKVPTVASWVESAAAAPDPKLLTTGMLISETLCTILTASGRRAGDHYEAFVRERLTGSYEKQDAARFVADLGGEQCRMLNELWKQAMTISEESTERLWDLLKPDERQAVAGRHSAVADIITEAEVNVKELLGSKAEVLLGVCWLAQLWR